MKKTKYHFNSQTLRFEKVQTPLRVKLLKALGFLAASIATAFLIVFFAFQYIDSPKEKILKQQNDDLRNNYTILNERIKQLELQMKELESRDNNVYRSIFEAQPVPDSARVKEMQEKREVSLVQAMSESELIQGIAAQLNNLSLRSGYQMKSYEEIEDMVKNKEKLLAAIPAIQPVSNKDLSRVASGFGYRIDPVYKTRRFHAGLDFTAPVGTPIYATADGVVKEAGYNTGGYGNNVVINHGFGFQTLYAHMYKIKARVGQKVKRGEVIGYIGNTGKSTGPHLHYEVHKKGQPVDPIYYFYNDLTPAQFERITKLAKASNQSLD
ncbi:MAG: peptidoglycan DD-metalloendopeptidase family protein [Sediminibacterium sp.]|jgi:murein DD-endopeptidase MepM/ murein hydrolase activator NlpD|nr:peptidoglycan DD-metalloendopeptidase family protein [Hydrotalea sp.]MCU0337539.1 peptidoglycan DD-metalloendopeptidase family protein [Sediminibacterium sp.]